ncbi:protein of unknown function [Thauera humireducens]|nr:protein of unknown function [Thauera humireducens]
MRAGSGSKGVSQPVRSGHPQRELRTILYALVCGKVLKISVRTPYRIALLPVLRIDETLPPGPRGPDDRQPAAGRARRRLAAGAE